MKKLKDRSDYSCICNKNDEDLNNPCWRCIYFIFPIGCMFYECIEEEKNSTIKE